ncbi:hypothetical protein H6G54_02065 [Anabaena cylindrica FACHB-243]|uniref:Fucosyltransferase C-terminal domain-containing protein n=1 Tax=Anabaena cylindrica (strain ATCC 27899 / PCC 7122) TaxID=272123 RepID=K9ZLG4_ANACC|nr:MULTISPECIES: glycosyltransferase family 10 [Anabaena]AFZ59165.1 hypothetical protein Anacy_3784 [Anabaena cylindrica PCC 7122]MBD2416515.1 hypothetical protein [Anabaena cylindrica FACHB-243]MBY5281087.1 hypothetical protein [Anabaena sp. CCAP 1446/1C]MBY5309874.1 hypothetical protein [Anabaena sp. CCAP 1446/1C]MCM2407453.1 glycosyltransferase family 10 [Anabaena sp. CCAP 1446/1C]
MPLIALLMSDSAINARNYFRPFITETGEHSWQDTQFVINPEKGKFDGIILYQSVKPLDRTYQLICPKNRTLLVLKEPPDILHLPEGYTRQFYCTLGQDNRVKSKMRVISYAGYHWYVEVNILDALETSKLQKTKLISAVISGKTDTVGHRKRLHFMYELKKHFGEQLDWFGRGIQELGSRKSDALLNYKYHIVLENGAWPHYWTEKLADAFVSNCFPFYWGAPNILGYFDTDALRIIDVDDIQGSIKIIEDAIFQDLYASSQSAIAKARNKVLQEYHPYQVHLELLKSLPASEYSKIVIKPHNTFKYDLITRLQMKATQYLV